MGTDSAVTSQVLSHTVFHFIQPNKLIVGAEEKKKFVSSLTSVTQNLCLGVIWIFTSDSSADIYHVQWMNCEGHQGGKQSQQNVHNTTACAKIIEIIYTVSWSYC